MFRLIVVALCAGVTSFAAQAITLGELKARNAVQLSTEELNQLLPGAKVVHTALNGAIRRWEGRQDGTLAASSVSGAASGGRAIPVSGTGTWRVDNGKFCFAIKWNVVYEDTCRYIFKADGKYYGVFKLVDTDVASEFEFSK